MANKEYIEGLRMIIRHYHGCDSTHLHTVPVCEEFQQKTIWEGEVEVFAVNHPKAKACYAWVQKEETTAVLGVPPINTAIDAVRASIVAFAKKEPE